MRQKLKVGNAIETSLELLVVAVLYDHIFVHEVALITFRFINPDVFCHPNMAIIPFHFLSFFNIPVSQLRNVTNYGYFLSEGSFESYFESKIIFFWILAVWCGWVSKGGGTSKTSVLGRSVVAVTNTDQGWAASDLFQFFLDNEVTIVELFPLFLFHFI
jgi:hypothetical protein